MKIHTLPDLRDSELRIPDAQIGTTISEETKIRLKAIDDNIRQAWMRAPSIMLD